MAVGGFILPMNNNNNTSGSSGDVWTEQGWLDAYNAYQRPVDWLTMPTIVDGDQKVAMLHKVDNHDSNFCALTFQGDYTVDWGDGTAVQNFASGVTAYHIFDYNGFDAGGATITSLGYKQAIVLVTPQAGQNLTSMVLNVKHNQVGLLPYSTGWLDIKMAGQFFARVCVGGDSVTTTTQNVSQRNLEIFDYIGSVSNSFNNISYMFYQCDSLCKIVNLDTSKSLNVSNMFQHCYSLTTIPLLNLSAMTTGTQMFQQCYSLTTIPLLNLSAMTTGSQMFQQCYSLTTIPLLNLSAMTTGTQMFQQCYSLTTIPLLNLSAMTNGTNMFQQCYSLKTIPLLNLSAMTNGTQMFQYCSSLTTIPLLNLSAMTTGSQMFQQCFSLTTIPLVDLSSMITGANMFSYCYSLTTIPLLNLSVMTNGSGMFIQCLSLTTIPLLNLSVMTNGSGMFQQCSSLTTIPLLNLSAMTTGTQMFQQCSSLTTIPLLNLSAMTTGTQMFQQCYSLTTIPLLNLSAMTTGSQMFQQCYSQSNFNATGIKVGTDFTSNRMSKTSLEKLFKNLSNNVTQTVIITGNYGADTAVSKSSCSTTIGSTTITQTNTSSLVVGMRVLGTGIDTAVAVTLQVTTDTITRTNHGIPNNKIVYFATLVTTTGITVKTPYYVINSTANTFQLSLTLGGSVIDLVGADGTGTIYYASYITAINTNVNFSVDVPASATGTLTLTSRLLDTSFAIGKGWAVTG
jgi:hypothetical protein